MDRNDYLFDAAKGYVPTDLAALLGVEDVGGDRCAALAGYLEAQTFGDEHGMGYVVYERVPSHHDDDDGKPPWLVCVRCTHTSCFVVCMTWPDLLTLLSQLSTIALASRLADPELKLPYREPD